MKDSLLPSPCKPSGLWGLGIFGAKYREELDAVAPRICRVEAPGARKRVVPLDLLSGVQEPLRESIELAPVESKRGMRLLRRREGILDADVQLLISERKPDAASRLERLGLLDLLEAENTAEESTRIGLASRRRGQLHVVDFHFLENELCQHLQRLGLRRADHERRDWRFAPCLEPLADALLRADE